MFICISGIEGGVFFPVGDESRLIITIDKTDDIIDYYKRDRQRLFYTAYERLLMVYPMREGLKVREKLNGTTN